MGKATSLANAQNMNVENKWKMEKNISLQAFY